MPDLASAGSSIEFVLRARSPNCIGQSNLNKPYGFDSGPMHFQNAGIFVILRSNLSAIRPHDEYIEGIKSGCFRGVSNLYYDNT